MPRPTRQFVLLAASGLIVALLGSYYVFLKYAKLTELSRGWTPAGDDRRG